MKFFKPEDCDFFTRELTDPSWRGQPCAISLDKANALYDAWLAKGKVAYGLLDKIGQPSGLTVFKTDQDTHKFLVLPLEAEDSAEKVLRDLIELANEGYNWKLSPILDRAEKLLAKKGER